MDIDQERDGTLRDEIYLVHIHKLLKMRSKTQRHPAKFYGGRMSALQDMTNMVGGFMHQTSCKYCIFSLQFSPFISQDLMLRGAWKCQEKKKHPILLRESGCVISSIMSQKQHVIVAGPHFDFKKSDL